MQKTKPRSKRSWVLLASVVALAVMALVPASAMAAPVQVKPILDFDDYATLGQWQPGAIDDDLVFGEKDLWWFNGNTQMVKGEYFWEAWTQNVLIWNSWTGYGPLWGNLDDSVEGVVWSIDGGAQHVAYPTLGELHVNFNDTHPASLYGEGIHTVSSAAIVDTSTVAGPNGVALPIEKPTVQDTFGVDKTGPEFAHVMSLKWDTVNKKFLNEPWLPLEKGATWTHDDTIYYNLDWVDFTATVHDPAGSGVAPYGIYASGLTLGDFYSWQVGYDDWMWEATGAVWEPQCVTAPLVLCATDMVGNKTTEAYHINFDRLAPITTYTMTPDADSQDEWTNKAVTVKFSAVEDQPDCDQQAERSAAGTHEHGTSGVAYTEYVVKQVASHNVPAAPNLTDSGTKGNEVTIDTTAPIGPTYIWFRSVDKAVPTPNYEEWQLVMVYFDNVAPTLSDSYPGWWMNTDFGVTLEAADHNSGIAAPGIEYMVSPYVQGHPSIWTGVGAYFEFDVLFGTLGDGIYKLGYRATDKAGNAAVAQTELKVDTNPPTTEGTQTYGADKWINGLEPYVLTAYDQTPGSGVAGTVYKVDNAAAQSSLWLIHLFDNPTSPAKTEIQIAGAHGSVHTIDFLSVDNARPDWWTPAVGPHFGNWEMNEEPTEYDLLDMISTHLFHVNLPGEWQIPNQATVKLDKVAPISTVTNPVNPNWQADTATLNFVGSDDGSGYKGTEFSTDGGMTWQLTTSGQAQVGGDGVITVNYRGVDNVGIKGETHTIQVKVATTGPSNQAKDASVVKGGKVTIKFRVNAVTEKASVNILIRKNGHTFMMKRYSQVTTNQWVSRTFKVDIAKGKYLIRVDATDLAGNVQLVRGQANLTVK